VTPEWDRFKFEIDKKSPELTTVRHVAHVLAARRIIEDGRVKAGLVYDKSRLNTSRISVSWVSANTWVDGSIYGTVEFQFTWADLVAGQNIYWVEAMEEYKPPAFRLLLSKRNDLAGPIMPYDPANDEGPLRLKADKYYWNGSFTSEFMIADDLPLERCTGLNFVSHHEKYCRPFGDKSEDIEKQPSHERTAGKMLAFVLGHGLHILDRHLMGANEWFSRLNTSYGGLARPLSKQVKFAGPISADDKCHRALRSGSGGSGPTPFGSDFLGRPFHEGSEGDRPHALRRSNVGARWLLSEFSSKGTCPHKRARAALRRSSPWAEQTSAKEIEALAELAG
jgi:hypothetical protein